MAKQEFRSTIEYADRMDTKGCCCVLGENPQYVSFSECVALNGYFTVSTSENCILEYPCPDFGDLGCCCACSYVDNLNDWIEDSDQELVGPQDNVTPCDCTLKGGSWYNGPCSDFDGTQYGRQTLCFAQEGTSPGDAGDVRWPHACCYVDQETNETVCVNVCSADDCNYPESAYYIDGRVCNFIGPDGQPPAQCYEGLLHLPRGEEEQTSSCVFPTRTGYACKMTNETICRDNFDGFYAGYDEDGNSIKCGEWPAEIANRSSKKKQIGPYEITTEQADNLLVGQDFYNLGIWCGVFTPGPPKNPEGSIISYVDNMSGMASARESNAHGLGSKKQKWGIVLANRDLNAVANFGSNNKNDTSSWDGKYNLYSKKLSGDLVDVVKLYKINGISGWTIPTIQECGFIQTVLDDPQTYVNYFSKPHTDHDNGGFHIPNYYSYITSTVIKTPVDSFVQAYNFVGSGSFSILDSTLDTPVTNNSGHEFNQQSQGPGWKKSESRRSIEGVNINPSVFLNSLTSALHVRLMLQIPISDV